MPRDVMPVFGRTPYKGPGKRGFTPPPPKTPSTTPFTRRKGGRPASRVTAPPPTTVPVIPTPRISQQGKGVISSVDKGNTKGDTSQETIQETIQNTISNNVDVDHDPDAGGINKAIAVDNPTKTTAPRTTPTDETSRSRQPRGDWWWRRHMQRHDPLIDPVSEQGLVNQWLQSQFSEGMAGMDPYWSRGRAQYASHDPSRYHQMLPSENLGDEAMENLLTSGLGAFHLPFNRGPLSEMNTTAEMASRGMQTPDGGIKAGHSYAMPGFTAGTSPWDVAWQDPVRHETVHDVNARTNALLDDVRKKVQSGEASAHARHPWGEVEKTILDLFPDELNQSMKDIDSDLYSRSIFGQKMDLEELITRVEDLKVGDPAMQKEAKETLDHQLRISQKDVKTHQSNVEALTKAVDDFYSGGPDRVRTLDPSTFGSVQIEGAEGKFISSNAIGPLEQALKSQQEMLASSESRLKGMDSLEDYWEAQNKALAAYHEAGGNLETRPSGYEKVRLPGTYDESWQHGLPYFTGRVGR